MLKGRAPLLLIPLLLITCSWPPSPVETVPTPGTGRISGVVVDADDGQPVSWATVHIVGTTIGTLADKNGHFGLTDIPPGTYSVEAAIMGWQRDVREGVAVSGSQVVELEFRLQRTAPLRSRPRKPEE